MTSLATRSLMTDQTAVGPGPAAADRGSTPSFEIALTGAGAVSATVEIQGRNGSATSGWGLMATSTLSGTSTASDLYAPNARYMEYRAVVTAIGAGTTVNVTMAEPAW